MLSILAKIGLIALFSVLAVIVGVQLGEESFALPLVIIALVIFGFVLSGLGEGIYVETIVVGLLIPAYMIGNRGFAQISLSQNFPAFIGEVGLVIGGTAMVFRLVMSRKSPIPMKPLSLTIFFLLLLGFFRMPIDLGRFGIMAIRDYAMIYYALFFYIGYHISESPRSLQFVRRALVVGSVGCLIPFLIVQIDPRWIYSITFRGIPVLYFKGDLLAMFLGVGSLMCFRQAGRSSRKGMWIFLSIVNFCCMVIAESRAVYFGLLLAGIVLMSARRIGYPMLQTAVVVIGLPLYLAISLLSGKSADESTPYRVINEVLSTMDLTAERKYSTESGEISARNNQFRLIWWKSVVLDTVQSAPITGLGFGADLGQRFSIEYGFDTTEAEVRSPHSYLFSIIGRMGILGTLTFVLITWQMVSFTRRQTRASRSKGNNTDVIFLWAVIWVFYGTAMFGVVFEGPMGAIPFWTLLGFAARFDVPKEPVAVPQPVNEAAPTQPVPLGGLAMR